MAAETIPMFLRPVVVAWPIGVVGSIEMRSNGVRTVMSMRVEAVNVPPTEWDQAAFTVQWIPCRFPNPCKFHSWATAMRSSLLRRIMILPNNKFWPIRMPNDKSTTNRHSNSMPNSARRPKVMPPIWHVMIISVILDGINPP